MLKLSADKLDKLFSAISDAKELYLPVEENGSSKFDKWSEETQVNLNRLNTVKSPKDLFFPQSEDLMRFKKEGKKITVDTPDENCKEFVVFGVRACDVKSIEVLDRVFLSEPVDTYYESKRKAATIVSLACSEPEESCFCNIFGIDATEPAADVSTWLADGYLYWEAKTEKGEALTESIKSVFEQAEDTSAVDAQKENVKAIIEKLPLSGLNLDYFKNNDMMDIFNSEKWDELYEACLGCGTCTFVCPTCQCYDIRDYDTGHGIVRYRCWDSCMYSDFTLMAGGQPRTTQKERFRQRFMHKLVYFPMNNDGEFSCVGCGRCVNKCPVRLNIAKVIRALGGEV